MKIMSKEELLFSYGTLQNTPVQLETFGRELEGYEDKLLGYRLEMVEIGNSDVVDLSGETHHPIAIESSDDDDQVAGVIFKITKEELVRSDKYEVDAYKRVMGRFKSGAQAWVYVSADDNNTRT
jgi:gamma-glutamylcyclotransferase (GGCT)/AIG2-like uncharacterized protein YtfP